MDKKIPLVAPLFHTNNFVTGLRKNQNFRLIIFQAVCLINNFNDLSYITIFNKLFNFFLNSLISLNQSGLKLGDFCIKELLAITHEFYRSFFMRDWKRCLSRYIEKFRHKCVVFMFIQRSIYSDLLNVTSDFLIIKKQELCRVDSHLLGKMFKAPFLVHYYSQSIKTIFWRVFSLLSYHLLTIFFIPCHT